MMTRLELVNTILYLMPDAKFAVWETNDLKHYHGEDSPIPMFNMLVDWNKANTSHCPTEEQIRNVDQSLVLNHHENLRKINRNNDAKNNLSLKANYLAYIKDSPNTTFSDYLDHLENYNIGE